jgi:outer membrane murein-binding lipoprotein Lpp
MKKTVLKLVLTALVAGMSLPLAAQAADDDLQVRIDKLSKEVADLKSSVKKVEDKSIGKWLTIGGEYRFRLDSLHGSTAAYSDAIGTMGNLVGVFTAPSGVAGNTIGGKVRIAFYPKPVQHHP